MTTPSTTDAAIYLLAERAREHDRKASRAQIGAIYVTATPTPETADTAVKITEAAYIGSTIAEAQFHRQEARRFQSAIEEIEALNK
jgi:hypothetical protein